MIAFSTFLLAAGAVLRLTRLVVDDTVTAGIRRRFSGGWLGTLLSCSWCASLWIAAPVAAVAMLWGRSHWFIFPAVVLSLAWLTGIAAQWLDAPPPPRELYVTHTNPQP